MLQRPMPSSGAGSPPLEALRVTSALRVRLEAASPAAGQVVSVYASTANLAWGDGGLVALHGPGDLRAPFAAAVPDGLVARLRPGSRVRREDGAIAIGDLTLVWRGADVVDVRVPPARPNARVPALGAAADTGSRGSAFETGLGRNVLSALVEGLVGGDPERVLSAALGLIGLGPGLTPAGDDCLVGVFAVLHRAAARWLASVPALRDGIDAAARTATTSVSAEFLRHALDGLFAEPLVALVTATTEDAAHGAAQRLRAHGATSGADTLLGVALGLLAVDSPSGVGRGAPLRAIAWPGGWARRA
jgi:Protein of unknown function (DUF2877)